MADLKTSKEWNDIHKNINIHDGDGWDRSPDGWNYSWNKELISEKEYVNRLMISTCSGEVLELYVKVNNIEVPPIVLEIKNKRK